MDIKIDLNADEVQKQVVAAIMNSAIGTEIEKAVNTCLTRSGGFNDHRTLVQQAIDEVVKREVGAAALAIIQERKESIKEQMRSRMSDEAINSAVERAYDFIFSRDK